MVVVAAAVIVVVGVVAAGVVALAVIVVSLGMLFCLQVVQFLCLLKGITDGFTDLRTYGRTLNQDKV